MVVNVASFPKLQEAVRFSKWSHSWKMHGLWCQPELRLSLHQNQAITPCCRVTIPSIHFYPANMRLGKLWRRRASRFALSSMNGLKAGSHGLVWKMRDPTKQPSPQLNSQCPFPCHLLTSLQPALNPHMVRFRVCLDKNWKFQCRKRKRNKFPLT